MHAMQSSIGVPSCAVFSFFGGRVLKVVSRQDGGLVRGVKRTDQQGKS